MRKIKFIYICLLLLLQQQVFAESVESIFQSLSSAHFSILSKDETLQFVSLTKKLNSAGLTWRPTLELAKDQTPCHPNHFREALAKSLSPELTLKDFWQRCESEWRLNSFNQFTHAAQILRTQFDPTEHPAVRAVQWTLRDQVKVRGLLFFKGKVRRPLVILRPGIFSQLRSSVAERFLMMQLFEEGPYHVLVIPSTTGRDYIELNHQFVFGGFDEGLQTFAILKLLNSPEEPLQRYISKIHLVGISLGGHGLWLTNLLNQAENEADRVGIIDKTLLLCPSVDLGATAEEQRRHILSDFFVNAWFNLRLAPLRQELDVAENEAISSVFEKALTNYKSPTLPWPLTGLQPPASPQPFWVWNSFWSWMPPYDFKRTFVLWTAVDPVVAPQVNAHTLAKQLHAPESALLELPRGLHCSLPTTYVWPAVSLTLRGYLDSRSLSKTQTWQHNFDQLASIKSVEMVKLVLEGDLKNFEVSLMVRFENPLLAPLEQRVRLPATLSDLNWVIADFNETLKDSLVREFSSRMKWSQTSKGWAISLE
jgi:hypothetical protein